MMLRTPESRSGMVIKMSDGRYKCQREARANTRDGLEAREPSGQCAEEHEQRKSVKKGKRESLTKL